MENKILVITDPGIDDAVAIVAVHKIVNKKRLGFLSTFGNNTLTHTYSNLQKILTTIDSGCVYFAGSDKPISAKYQPFIAVHGIHGLGQLKNNTSVSSPVSKFWKKNLFRKEFPSPLATKFMNSSPKIKVVSLAPLTDLSKIINISEFAKKISSILIMGGCLNSPGNASMSVEANFFYDPKAVSEVFKSKIPITLFPLNLTENIQLNDSYFNKVDNTKKANILIKKITPYYINYYTKHKKHYFSPSLSKTITYTGASFHDICPVIYLKFPKLFKTTKANVSINPNTGEILLENYQGKQVSVNSRQITLVVSVNTHKLLLKLIKILNIK